MTLRCIGHEPAGSSVLYYRTSWNQQRPAHRTETSSSVSSETPDRTGYCRKRFLNTSGVRGDRGRTTRWFLLVQEDLELWERRR